MSTILIIDDDKMLCEMVCRKLGNMGHEAACAFNLSEGLAAASRESFDLILLDVRLPDGNGIEALTDFKSTGNGPEIIIITGEGDEDGAELAIETGAWDYIEKPLSMREIKLHVTRVLEYRLEKAAFKPPILLKKDGIIGEDPKLKACLEQVAHSAPTDAPILITGETGTGKELFARAVHANSPRAKGPFVVLDCAAVPDKLVESILFGHRKGAFTSAEKDRDGLILQADKGTLFMDEVGELPFSIQKAFLRVLQEHRFRPVGGRAELKSDFRLVTATNRDIMEMVRNGEFRNDLYFRINAAPIRLPALRERTADIEYLTHHFISIFCRRGGMPTKGISPEFMQHLLDYEWPGNIREMINTIDVAIGNAREHDVLYPTHLPVDIRVKLKRRTISGPSITYRPRSGAGPDMAHWPSLKDTIERMEKEYFTSLMVNTTGDIHKACTISGLSRSALYGRLKKYGIERPS